MTCCDCLPRGSPATRLGPLEQRHVAWRRLRTASVAKPTKAPNPKWKKHMQRRRMATSNTPQSIVLFAHDCSVLCSMCWTLLGSVATHSHTFLKAGFRWFRQVRQLGQEELINQHLVIMARQSARIKLDQTGSNRIKSYQIHVANVEHVEHFESLGSFLILSASFLVLYTNLWICCSHRSTSTLQTPEWDSLARLCSI